jgi:hypothetical protein
MDDAKRFGARGAAAMPAAWRDTAPHKLVAQYERDDSRGDTQRGYRIYIEELYSRHPDVLSVLVNANTSYAIQLDTT